MKMMEEKQSFNIFIKMSICAAMPGNIKQSLEDQVGIIYQEVDLEMISEVRRDIPIEEHQVLNINY